MKETIKILLIEDSAADAEIIQRLLLTKNLNGEFKIVIDKKTYLQALDQFHPDIILSDHSLPGFNSIDAPAIAREKYPGIPFIIVTGTVSEEFAADIIKLGADDYILKDRLARLPVAITTVIKRRKAEKEKQETEQKIKQSETNLRIIFENTSEGFLLMDTNAVIMAFNNKAEAYTFFSDVKKFQVGQSIYNFIEEPRKEAFREIIAKVLNGENIQYDRSYELENGITAWIDFSLTPVMESGQVKGVCITGRDITEKKMLEEKILEQNIQQQKKIARAIIKAQEKERNYIGQELHDNINQILVGIKLHLGMAQRDEELKKMIQYPLDLLDSAIYEIRILSSQLVTPLKNINLKDLIQRLLADLSKNAVINTSFVYNLSNLVINDDLKLNIYRIVQEQLNNTMKHADAKNLAVCLQADNDVINIVILDDGKGFDVNKKRSGIGISNMINRVESYNGEVNLETSPGRGCKLKIRIPY